LLQTEFNIEGYPSTAFIDMVTDVKPAQVTLVPDPPDVLTSNAGWDTIKFKDYLKEIILVFKQAGIRTSIFIDPVEEMILHAADTGTDRVELYTEAYAGGFSEDKEQAIEPYIKAAERAKEVGLGLNAGHDLSLENLQYFAQHIPGLLEVSIGHALIADALYFGLENTIQQYKRQLNG
jgi:pyridoxine 5-phosphate synthase